LIAEIEDLNAKQRVVEESPERNRRAQAAEEEKRERQERSMEEKKKEKLAFGPGARDFRKGPSKAEDARKKAAQRDRERARKRRERAKFQKEDGSRDADTIDDDYSRASDGSYHNAHQKRHVQLGRNRNGGRGGRDDDSYMSDLSPDGRGGVRDNKSNKGKAARKPDGHKIYQETASLPPVANARGRNGGGGGGGRQRRSRTPEHLAAQADGRDDVRSAPGGRGKRGRGHGKDNGKRGGRNDLGNKENRLPYPVRVSHDYGAPIDDGPVFV